MVRDDQQLKVRLPANLKTRVEETAKIAGRSVNTEIVQRLRESLDGPLIHCDAGVLAQLFEEVRALRALVMANSQGGRDGSK